MRTAVHVGRGVDPTSHEGFHSGQAYNMRVFSRYIPYVHGQATRNLPMRRADSAVCRGDGAFIHTRMDVLCIYYISEFFAHLSFTRTLPEE